MNLIKEQLEQVQEKKEKAFITYITAGMPNEKRCMEIIRAQEEAGVDVVELGIPFSDPVADGPVIQEASYRSILQGTTLTTTLKTVKEYRAEGGRVPIVFMMYYNTILAYGVDNFAKSCAEAGVNGVIVPDLPFEEQDELRTALESRGDATYLIQLVSPISGKRIPKILKEAKGFVYCVSSMGVTGQEAQFYGQIKEYLAEVKRLSKVPVMMGFGIRTAKDVEEVKDHIDGAIVGSHFISLMEETRYSALAAADYVKTFKAGFNA